MKCYEEFHGEIPSRDIGKKLREIVKLEKKSFKIMTGYGSTSGKCVSRSAAITVLTKLKQEGQIKGFILGDAKTTIYSSNSMFYEDKIKYSSIIKEDKDYGNDGIIFIIK